jgi:hypothetical protein
MLTKPKTARKRYLAALIVSIIVTIGSNLAFNNHQAVFAALFSPVFLAILCGVLAIGAAGFALGYRLNHASQPGLVNVKLGLEEFYRQQLAASTLNPEKSAKIIAGE